MMKDTLTKARRQLNSVSGGLSKISFPSFIGRLSIKEQVRFAKRLSFLIRSGVPVLDSLHVLRDQTLSRSTNHVLDRVVKDVANGRFLSKSLDRFRHHFGEFAINIIAVGESSGVLSQNLAYLAEELEKKEALRKKVVSALVYPIFITLATLGVTSMLVVYIFPKILPIFNSVGVSLPLTTRILISVSDFLRSWGLLLFALLVVLGVGTLILHRNAKAFRMVSDRILLRIPVSGRIMQYYNMANLCRTLGLLLKSGVAVVDALDTTARTTRNRVYRSHLRKAAIHAKKGARVSEYLQGHKFLFPIIATHMVSIGEKTGNLADTLVYLSELYETEVDTQTKNLSHAIEPVLMILMGLLVGFVAVSVITPIYEITQSISNQI